MGGSVATITSRLCRPYQLIDTARPQASLKQRINRPVPNPFPTHSLSSPGPFFFPYSYSSSSRPLNDDSYCLAPSSIALRIALFFSSFLYFLLSSLHPRISC